MIDSFSGPHRFLSNFYESRVVYDGVVWPTAEHAYQAAKTNDLTEKQKILEAQTPTIAKSLGKKVTLRSDWNDVRIGIMNDIVRAKFIQSEVLKQKLLDTADQELIEGNYWGDTFWGVCRGVGENNLGKILVQVRQSLMLAE